MNALDRALRRVASAVVPDPFVLALGITALMGLIGMRHLVAAGHADPINAVLVGWVTGFTGSGGLAFALQMCLILVTGHALALSPPVQRAVVALSKVPNSAAAATALVAFVAGVAGVVHWGLGAIVGALLAREIGRASAERGVAVHYPLLGAAAYSGLAVWHGGLSGSAPLKVAEEGHFFDELVGTVPASATLGSTLNLVTTGALVVGITVLYFLLTPSDPGEDVAPPTFTPSKPREEDLGNAISFVDWLQRSSRVGIAVGASGLAVVIALLVQGKINFDVNAVNLLFLFSGVLLQSRLDRYVDAISDGARGAGGIILQFPFYFGILGIMQAAGLVAWVSDTLASAASANTFPVVAFFMAGIVNFFVPSGGGQWAVQGEVLLNAGNELGVAPETTILAFSYGDAWTNMLQPFWALPLLGIMGLKAKDIIGYTAMVFLLMGLIVPACLLTMG